MREKGGLLFFLAAVLFILVLLLLLRSGSSILRSLGTLTGYGPLSELDAHAVRAGFR